MGKTDLAARATRFIQRYDLIPRKQTVVVAVSGGADSVCLLHILANSQRELGIKLHVSHLNHELRGAESEADAEYVSSLARSLGIPVTTDRQDVAGYRTERNCSIEEAARELRYAFLARVAREVGANRVAVGHTRDDQVETILMHILRGTGISGLGGLAPCSPLAYRGQTSEGAEVLSAAKGQRGNLLAVRPLLDITREETASYCREHALAPRIDSSNLSLSFFRNRLRLQLLPLLRQYNPGIDQALLRLAEIAREDSALIEQEISGLWDRMARQKDNTIYLDRKQVAGLPTALQRHLLRRAVTRLIGDTRDIEATHIEAVRHLLNKPVGKRVSLPHRLTCYGEYDELAITSLPSATAGSSLPVILSEAKNLQTLGVNSARQSSLLPSPLPPLSGEFPLKVPGQTLLPGWKTIASIVLERRKEAQSDFVAYFDLHKAGAQLFVRQRRRGDRFQPLGMGVPKKLYKFMVDAKIPRFWRDNIPVVCSPQQIVWVVGWRIDDRVKLTEASQEVLRLEFISSHEQSVYSSPRAPEGDEAVPTVAAHRQVGARNDREKLQTPLAEAVDSELRLRRLTVEEALWRLDRYLYDAFMVGMTSVRIVHGKGTGTLRYAVHESLARHPLVESYRLGGYGEGGYGVTIAELKNR